MVYRTKFGLGLSEAAKLPSVCVALMVTEFQPSNKPQWAWPDLTDSVGLMKPRC